MIKTAIENDQNMIIEGCYFPYDWYTYFDPKYLKHIKFICLIMSTKYIEEHFDDIKKYASIIENRRNEDFNNKELLQRDNRINLEKCRKYGCDYIMIEDAYKVDIDLD